MTIDKLFQLRAVNSDKVYTTLLTNLEYLPGVLTLEYSLRRVGSKYPLVVLYTDTLPPAGLAVLHRRGIPTEKVDYLLPKVHKDFSKDVRFYDCWSKMQPFSLTQYSCIVQLDSDMLILRNIDELMNLPLDEDNAPFAAGFACTCNPKKKSHYPKDWVPETCAFTQQSVDPEAAQQTLQCWKSRQGLGICNGGLLVVKPSAKNYTKILNQLSSPSATSSYDFADQSLLSDLFRGKWIGLSYVYNALKTMRTCHKEIWRDEEVRNVHYILGPKPWNVQPDHEDCEEMFHWWWDITRERKKEECASGVIDEF